MMDRKSRKKEYTVMRRLFSFFTLCAVILCGLLLVACDNNYGNHSPDSSEMQANLKQSGYSVTITADLGERTGTYLSATKDDDYIEFYWLDTVEDCDYFYDFVKTEYPDCEALACIINEDGNHFVYCGTRNAIETAGVKVIIVKVKV